MNSNMREWFRMTAGFRQACFLSSTFFNIFPKRIMSGSVENMMAGLAYTAKVYVDFTVK